MSNPGPLPEPLPFRELAAAEGPAYTAEQMRAYAADAVAKERERCAALCDQYAAESSNPMNFASNCAEAIRKG